RGGSGRRGELLKPRYFADNGRLEGGAPRGRTLLVHLRANTDNIDPILPLGNLLPQRQTRINANGS
ncbi:MAG: hypothetical protein, partial [Olavius algarvensis Gamma 1 endosymbiont]